MVWFIAAAISLFLATMLDFVVRLRMEGIGHKRPFLRGGTLDDSEYGKVREKYGWSAWPVRIFWICATLGIVLLGVACVRGLGV